jgi:hypothetical protein
LKPAGVVKIEKKDKVERGHGFLLSEPGFIGFMGC